MARSRKRCTCCAGKATTRGMCKHCRDDAKWLIDNAFTNEAALMEAGLLLPKLPLGRPPTKKHKAVVRSLDDNTVWQRLQEAVA